MFILYNIKEVFGVLHFFMFNNESQNYTEHLKKVHFYDDIISSFI